MIAAFKMMFDEVQVFRGLTAWFSSSCSARVKSIWIKQGGLQSDDFTEADYVFSSSAHADDTKRVFASSKFENEELTVFKSALIEDCAFNRKASLSGKYVARFILIQPQYQTEMNYFQKRTCPRNYRSKLTSVSRALDQHADRHKKVQSHDDESPDEWDFVDESDTRVRSLSDVRRLSEGKSNSPTQKNLATTVEQRSPSKTHRLPSIAKPTDHSPYKRLKVIPQEEDVRNLCENLKDKFINSAKEKSPTRTDQRKHRSSGALNTHNTRNSSRKWKSFDKDYSRHDEGSPMKIDTCLSDGKDKEQRVNTKKHQIKSKSASSAASKLRLQFLSSMDNGFVHINDVVLPSFEIDDFIPNVNGCRVELK